MNLEEKYNLYIIKKGTELFRQASDTNYDDEMFFGFSVFAKIGSSRPDVIGRRGG